MQTEAQVRGIERPLHGVQPLIPVVQHVRVDEARLEAVPVAEELVPGVDVPLLQLDGDDLGRGDAVVDEAPEVLADAAGDVEVARGRVVLEAGEELRVAWAVGEVEVEEVKFADAGVGEDLPDLVALWMASCEHQAIS